MERIGKDYSARVLIVILAIMYLSHGSLYACNLRVPIGDYNRFDKIKTTEKNVSTLNILYDCDDIDVPTDEIAASIKDYLGHFLNIKTYQPIIKDMDVNEKVEEIVKILLGSRKTRLGRVPSEENIEEIKKRIRESIKENIPIEVVMTWAPKKHLVIGEDNAIDLNELIALERLYDIHKNIQKVYAHGLHYTFYIEDLAGDFIEGRGEEVQKAIENYSNGMQELVKILDVEDVLTFISTNELAKEEHIYEDMIKRMNEIYPKIRAYWLESEEKGIEGFRNYNSYKELTKLGWEGEIPQQMRDYYLGRAFHLYGDTISLDEKKLMVMRDLTQVLVAAQFNILRGQGKIAPLKISFVNPAPGIPLNRMKARIDLRPVIIDVTKNSRPPWTGKGYLAFRKGKILPQMKSWRDPVVAPDRMVRSNIILSNKNKSIRIRADYLVIGQRTTVSKTEEYGDVSKIKKSVDLMRSRL